MKQIKDNVKHIANELTEGLNKEDYETEDNEEPTAYDYLDGALDINYLIDSSGNYLGAKILVAFGGPNIWVHTREGVGKGYWWADRYEKEYIDNIGLDSACEEYFNSTR